MNTISNLPSVTSQMVNHHHANGATTATASHGHLQHGGPHPQNPYHQQHMDEMMLPIDESPQTQMNSVYPMMWPNVPAFEAADQFMDDAWMDFLGGEGAAEGGPDAGARGWYGQ